MLDTLKAKNFTVFSEAEFRFSPGLNVFIGENGSGKTHLLKMVYAILISYRQEEDKDIVRTEVRLADKTPTKDYLEQAIANKLMNTFRSRKMNGLVRYQNTDSETCEIDLTLRSGEVTRFTLAKSSNTLTITSLLSSWQSQPAVFFPTYELLTLTPLYAREALQIDETHYDTCSLLKMPPRQEIRDCPEIKDFLALLEEAIGGKMVCDSQDRFSIQLNHGEMMEIDVLAEGLRKLAMLYRLIESGSLRPGGYFFWDEPEAHLNPRLIRLVARAIFLLCRYGLQVFVATHSLFLLNELNILGGHEKSEFTQIDQSYFALSPNPGGVLVQQNKHFNTVWPVVVLDEELQQANRFMEVEV